MTDTRLARLSLAVLTCASLAGPDPLRAQSALAPTLPPSAPADGGSGGPRSAAKPTIVLVHGAFADGTGWQHVIPILQRDGYTVIAVQNPLASLAGDVETTKRLIDAPIGAYIEKYPSALGAALTKPDAAGFLYIDRAQFRDVFARDVSATEAGVMAAAQKPVSGAVFGASVETPAWKTIPSWYVVAQEDRAINPDLERFYAKRMGAKTTEIKASHVVFVSHPKEVARVIEQAASSAVNTASR